MTDEAPPLGSVMRLLVDPEPDPRFGPENALGRDRLEFELYAKLQSVAAGNGALGQVAELARAGADRLAAKAEAARDGRSAAQMMTTDDFEVLACTVLAAALRRTEGEAIFGFRWRVVPRERVDHDALAVEVAASRARVRRWFSI
jgi:hypothetical protein